MHGYRGKVIYIYQLAANECQAFCVFVCVCMYAYCWCVCVYIVQLYVLFVQSLSPLTFIHKIMHFWPWPCMDVIHTLVTFDPLYQLIF